ncbi:hypothetical protein MNBD_CPR01-572 [hydrothermal vent metagenome]|uniref:THIF-type NAD/FAD binding fold domain-containing protein n=1 Tax=hydrothermal vent metagenome TaxID=652676 RepID=A0A3B0V8Y2_9ZZZZ
MNKVHPKILHSETEVREVKDKHSELREVNAFDRQLKELFIIENTKFIGIPKEKAFASDEFKKYLAEKENTFVYVHFPWINTLVKTVDSEDYFSLITNRNQDLITAKEQNLLRKYNIAVFGMSVGSNIALVLAQSGISNSIVVADFDELDTTNLNRILAGIQDVGTNKSVVTARRIYESNPFADVTVLTEGINEELLEEMLSDGKINCIVEEIDNFPFKIHTRILAMKYKVPVVTVTDNGDGVILHVERYDLGHDKIWGKPVQYYEEKLKTPATKEEMGSIIINDVVGGPHHVDSKMLASVKRVLANELVSWTQLGSAAILGGVIATYAIKQIALGNETDKDIRVWVSPEKIEKGNHSAS